MKRDMGKPKSPEITRGEKKKPTLIPEGKSQKNKHYDEDDGFDDDDFDKAYSSKSENFDDFEDEDDDDDDY